MSVNCIHESFHEQVEKTPDAVCLVDVDINNSDSDNTQRQPKQLTYRQVQRRVITLANELRQAGAGKNAVVAIFMEPSVDYVIAMLAILSAGAGYVPLELAYPSKSTCYGIAWYKGEYQATKQTHNLFLPVTFP